MMQGITDLMTVTTTLTTNVAAETANRHTDMAALAAQRHADLTLVETAIVGRFDAQAADTARRFDAQELRFTNQMNSLLAANAAAAAAAAPVIATPIQMAAIPVPPDAVDPWWHASLGLGNPGPTGPSASRVPSSALTVMHDLMKTKDFNHITAFNAEPGHFPYWNECMVTKLSRALPEARDLLSWAEKFPDMITDEIEAGSRATSGVEVVEFSKALSDILLERTGKKLFDKRQNCGPGHGLEFWRVLKRDFGMESADAKFARLQMFVRPGKC